MPNESGVERCLSQIRAMVLDGELLPGEKVLQSDLADRLGVSRIPVREALSRLHSEGVIEHRPNTGYTVARFNSEDLAEIYLMRRLLETELIKTTDLAQVDLKRMRALHKELSSVSPDTEREKFERLNQEFHFTLFEASPLTRVLQEVERLWYMSGFYRAMLLYEAGSSKVQADHRQIIDAIKQQDTELLIKVSDTHRHDTELTVVKRLAPRRPRRP